MYGYGSKDDGEFDFSELEKAVDAQKVIFEKMAELLTPLFKALRSQGLSTQDAAVLTATYFQQSMSESVGPQEGS